MGHRILSVASEWFSFHGGLSSFNRSFCAALASAGHEVSCLVPRATQPEHEDSKRVGVSLVSPEPVPGLPDEALLCLGVELGFRPDIVIGHGHITGTVAAARVRQFHRDARRIHVLHTLPDEIEPFKDREGEDPAQRAHRKQETETALSISASLAVAVGPRLHRQWSTYIGGASGVGVHRLTPGLSDLKPVGAVPAAYWCLLMGRLEDAELKGVNLAGAALGIINKDKYFRGSREVTLVLRGAENGKSKELRGHVHKLAGAEIPCTIREYTHREEHVRQDIARSSVVLMPSQMEGFGLVGFEALAMGVPILVSQRSGLGELLVELIDVDPALDFARRYIVDVGDGLGNDAERWAEAIRGVLVDRARAFSETAVLREAILKADYWRRAVADLFGVLKIPPRDPKTPPDTPPDLTQRAHKILEIDPATAIVYSSSLLEREMERVVTSKDIAKPALPASQYLALLRNKGLLDPVEADLARKALHMRNMAAHKFDATFTKDMAEEHMRLVEVLVEKLKNKYPSEASSESDENDLSKRASAAYQKGAEAETIARQSPEHVEKAREAADAFAEAARLTEEQQSDEAYTDEVRKVARPLALYYWAVSYKNQSWYEYEKRECQAALDSLSKEASFYKEAIKEAERLIPELSDRGKEFLQPQLESWRVYLEQIPSIEYSYRARDAWEGKRLIEALDWYRHSINEGRRVLDMADRISPRSNPAAGRIMRANARTTIANSAKALARFFLEQSWEGKFDLYDFSRAEGLQFFGHLLEAYESAVAGIAENPEGEHINIPLKADRANLEKYLRDTVSHWGAICTKFPSNKTICTLMEQIDPKAYATAKENRVPK